MRYRVTFAVGFAAGFIAGARAGRERYEQIKKVAHIAMDSPAVQQAAGALRGQAGGLAQTARHKVQRTPLGKGPRMGGSEGCHRAAGLPAFRATEVAALRVWT